MVLSSGWNGGSRGVIDKAPGEEGVPMPQVEWRESNSETHSTHTHTFIHTHHNNQLLGVPLAGLMMDGSKVQPLIHLC